MKSKEVKKILENQGVFIHRPTVLICNGNFRDAAVLDQLLHWSVWAESVHRKSFYWSNVSAYEQIGISRGQLDSAIKSLKKLGFISTENHYAEGKKQRWFTINPENIANALNSLSSPIDEYEYIQEDMDEDADTYEERERLLNDVIWMGIRRLKREKEIEMPYETQKEALKGYSLEKLQELYKEWYAYA